MAKNLLLAAVLVLSSMTAVLRAQEVLTEQSPWKNLAVSIAFHGAGTGFDSYSSWQKIERNKLLAGSGGRFTGQSAGRKAGIFAGISSVEILLARKWGRRHPWIVKACAIGNFGTAGMMFAAGMHNTGNH
jgi:hypothetical protein